MTTSSGNRRIRRVVNLVVATLLLPFVAVACSNDSPGEAALAPSGTATGTRPDTTVTNAGNAVAGIRIMPQQITLLTDGSLGITVLPVDANGVPSMALLAGRPVLTVADRTIAVVVDTNNTLRGIAAGVTKLYATYGALKDSAVVTVLAERDTSTTGGPPTTPGTPSTPVSVFSLTVYAFGHATPATARDTANVVQLPGATVSLFRLSANPSMPADTMGVRTLVKTVTADASGKAVIPDLASGYYSISASATLEGATVEGKLDFGPPRQTNFAVAIYLNRH